MTLALVFFFFSFIFAPQALAYTNPQIATSSASATVPSSLATTSDTYAPTNPILIRPEDGTNTNDNRTEFVWRGSADPNGNTLTYTLYLNGVATYLGVSNIGNSSGNGYTARIDGQEIKLHPSISLLDGVYDWHVTASDPAGNTSHSTTWRLTVDTTAPPLTLIDLDTYHNPIITEGSNFDIAGPKDVNFSVLSDLYTRIQISITSNDSLASSLTSRTQSSGLAYLYKHLSPGLYTISILAIDQAGNSSFLPDFTLNITQAEIVVSLPGTQGSIPKPIITIPYTPLRLTSLPATIASVRTRLALPHIIVGLLAATLILLLVFIWRRRYNLVLLDPKFRPIHKATIYHSIPSIKSHMAILQPGHRGRLYIPHLTKYSTLTIRLEESESCTTSILSISIKRQLYTIIIG